MKRKFSIFINVMLMVLCISSIAFGVYSAKTASLNVTGTIGFTAHNCDVDIVGYIYGHSLTPNGTPVPKPTQNSEKKYLVYGDSNTSTGTTPLPVRGDTKSLSFNINTNNTGFYFSDLGESSNPEEIKIVIQVTNVSDFNVIASPNITASTSTGNKVAISADKSAVIINQGEATAQEITFSLRLLPDSDGNYTTLDSAVSISLQMNFEKTDKASANYKSIAYISEFTTAKQTSVRSVLFNEAGISDTNILCYAERFPYYVEMGTDPTNTYSTGKLRWLIVGTMDASDKITLLGEEDKAAFAEGLMLNKNYCLLSENCLFAEDNSSNWGLSFQNAYTSGDCLNTKYGVSANDYATSTVREYLKGNTVQGTCDTSSSPYTPSGNPVNLMTTYNLSNDPLYSQIQARTLNSLYTKMSDSGTDVTVPTSNTSTVVDTTADKLWLLSYSECQTIFAEDYISDNDQYIYGSAITTVQGALNSYGCAIWWLRSPDSTFANRARYVHGVGYLNRGTVHGDYGVRAAFKI